MSDRRDKPRPLYFESSKKGVSKLKVRQSAAECLCLVRYLPFMIGDMISKENKYWKFFLHLRRIGDIVTSPRLRKAETSDLRVLIQKHNLLYLELFDHLKPKMHFMVHYPRIIGLYGPLVHFSANMFERKNKIMKDHASSTTNSLFLPYTIAKGHQLRFCYTLDYCPVKEDDITLGPKNPDAVPTKILKQFDAIIPPKSDVVEQSYIKILNKIYRIGTVFVSSVDETPQF